MILKNHMTLLCLIVSQNFENTYNILVETYTPSALLGYTLTKIPRFVYLAAKCGILKLL